MQYRVLGKTGVSVSALGFGTMRFPLKEDGTVDEARAIAMIRHGIDSGINYVDTAYPYHQGTSETIVGKALQDGYREKTYLATKCPVWQLEKPEDFDRILEEQLKKLQTETIDFYLLHALNRERFEKVLEFGLIEKMKAAREAGKIRYLGFSFHDEYPVFQEIVDVTEDWDFCQIQYNYIDLEEQAGTKGLRYAAEKGLGVIIMEPLLGGKLANPAPHVTEALGSEKTPVEYALDFLWEQSEVSLLLSGMSDEKQVEDNLTYADRSKIGMITGKEREQYRKAKDIFDRMALVNCTGCAYCMPCPAGLSIPDIFAAYNKTAVAKTAAKADYEKQETRADSCIGCGHCEEECPQQIKVSGLMPEIAKAFS